MYQKAEGFLSAFSLYWKDLVMLKHEGLSNKVKTLREDAHARAR